MSRKKMKESAGRAGKRGGRVAEARKAGENPSMKAIFSRKGFDSGYGGVPSPVMPDMTLASLPIPGSDGCARYGRIDAEAFAHLDPDLSAKSMDRIEGWRGSLGHLAGQGVGAGDVFLFFGWFREASFSGKRCFKPKTKDFHALFGYLQIASRVDLGARPDAPAILEQYPWLRGHPHLSGERDANNALYIGSEELVLDGAGTGLRGYGCFGKLDDGLALSAPGEPKSKWILPPWVASPEEGGKLSYHGDAGRWSRDAQGRLQLQTVAKGQEFVAPVLRGEEFGQWLVRLASGNPDNALRQGGMTRKPAR